LKTKGNTWQEGSDLALRPLDDRAWVEPTDAEEKTAGGILLPTRQAEAAAGKVVAVRPREAVRKGERTRRRASRPATS